jgi:succinoglycan biosynthesis protein ExoL
MLKVLYLVHDLSDPAVRRRVLMLREGGAEVTLAGFRRGENRLADVHGVTPIELGRTADARFAQRIGAVAKAMTGLNGLLKGVSKPDVIIGRNLEALAVADRANALFGGDVPVVYECLDIHRLLSRDDLLGKAMRGAEARFGRNTRLIMTSSPAFIEHHFAPKSGIRADMLLIENKVIAIDDVAIQPSIVRPLKQPGQPWKIGWFGALRCRKSLELLADVSRRMEGRVEIVLRGRPAYSEFEDFDRFVRDEPHLRFEGPYRNPEDLRAIYDDVHFSWAIDFFEEGLNSSWLLPNRLYEGCLYGTVPIALEGTQTARFLGERNIGLALPQATASGLQALFETMTGDRHSALSDAVGATDRKTWLADRSDCEALVASLSKLVPATAARGEAGASMTTTISQQGWTTMKSDVCNSVSSLIIIPCLNEEKHIEPLLGKLSQELDHVNGKIVVADGGSKDATREIVARMSMADPRIMLLDNPRRLQSAATNLAVATFGRDYEYLIRIDAHGDYPADYCQPPRRGRRRDPGRLRGRGNGNGRLRHVSEGHSRCPELQARQWRLQASRGRQGALDQPWPSRADAHRRFRNGRRL